VSDYGKQGWELGMELAVKGGPGRRKYGEFSRNTVGFREIDWKFSQVASQLMDQFVQENRMDSVGVIR
jgi:hypothetical protein